MPSKLSKKELKDIFQWDIENWSNVLPFWEEHSCLKSKSNILALGENEGGLSMYFAKKGHHVICSDYELFPEEAKTIHKEYKVIENISYKKIDMRKIELEDNSMDAIVFKSVLGVLRNKEAQEEAIKEIYRVLKPGGELLFAENLKGSITHQYLRKKFISWGDSWRYPEIEELENWTSSFSSFKHKTHGTVALFGRSEKQRKTLSSFDKILSLATPKKWRYILFGIAVK